MIRKYALLFLTALLCCALLSACGETPPEPEPPEMPPETSAVADDPLDFRDNEALRGFLLGTWEYRLPGSAPDAAPVLTLTLLDDASYRIEASTEGCAYTYEGVWAQTAMNAKEEEPLDGFHLSPKPGSDALCGGDFILYAWSACDGDYLIHLDPISADPSVFSINWNEYDATLRKQEEAPAPSPVGEPKKDAHFNAVCWKVSEDQRTMWLDDVQDEDIDKNEGRHEAIPYVVREDCEQRCGVDAFLRGGSVAEVWTNADGEITILNWAVKSFND